VFIEASAHAAIAWSLFFFLPSLRAHARSVKEKDTNTHNSFRFFHHRIVVVAGDVGKHLPPDDFYVPFPNEPYEDKMCDEFGRSYERLARSAEEAASGMSPKPRVEIVLERYPAGLHGIECTFDRAPNNGDRVVSPYGVSGGPPGKAKRVSYDVVIRPPPLEGQRSRMSLNRPSNEGGKPVPPQVMRIPSDTSLVPMGGLMGPGRVLSQDLLDLSGLPLRHAPVPEGEEAY